MTFNTFTGHYEYLVMSFSLTGVRDYCPGKLQCILQWIYAVDVMMQALKTKFNSGPVLVLQMPDPDCRFVVEVDALDSWR